MDKLSREILIQSKQGLHARPAAMFVQTASKYNAQVTITKDDQTVNGKSIMGILTLGAHSGSTVRIDIEGENPEDLMNELVALLIDEDS